MTVTIKIPGIWRGLTGGAAAVAAAGATVGDALEQLATEHPPMRERLFDGEGRLKRFVHIFLDLKSINDLAGLDSPLRDGAEILILMAIAGGAE